MAQVSQTKAAKEEIAAKQMQDIVPKLNKNALSTDIGPKVAALLDRSLTDATAALDLEMAARGKKYEAMSMLTIGIAKAAMADPQVKLGAAFSGERKQMEVLMKQLGLALGFRQVISQKDGDKEVQRVVVADAVAKYFPSANDDPKSAEYARKNTFRANFATAVKTAAQAAEGIIISKAKMEYDTKEGTLRLTGPKVKEMFGQDNVLLNENASQHGKDKQLSQKPSFTAIRALAGEAHDAPVHRGTNTRGTQIGASAPKPTDPDTNLISMAHMLIQGIGKYEGAFSPKVKEALEQVVNTIKAKGA